MSDRKLIEFLGESLLISAASDGESCEVSVVPKYAIRSVLWVEGSANRMLGYVRWKTSGKCGCSYM